MSKIKRVLMLLGNYDPGTHRGIARAAKDLGWHLNVSMLSAFQIPSRWHGDGILCSLDNNKTLEDLVLSAKLPTVDLSTWRMDLDFPRVSADNQHIGKLAADHFCSYGHHHFGWFCHQPNQVAQSRYQSFKQALKEQGMSVPARLVGKRTQNPANIMHWLQQLPKPAGLFAYNDIDAAWLLSMCLEAGFQIPEDFAILGVDNNPLICEHQPIPLSSINHDHERIGYEGAQLLDRIMQGAPPPSDIQYIQPNGITLRASSDALAVSDPLVRETLNYLIDHLHEQIGTPQVAKALGVSRRKLEIQFQKTLNTSIHKKLTELRLNRAEILLRTTDQKIKDIAAATGFCHAPHLCGVFKKRYGEAPLTYRKNHFSQ